MVGGRLHVDIRIRTDKHIVITHNTVLGIRVDAQGSRTAEGQLTLTEERALHILVVHHRVRRAVGQLIRSAILHHHIHTFSLVVNGCSGRIGDVHAIEDHLKLLLTVDLERTVAGRSTQFVSDVLDGGVDRYVGTVFRDGNTLGLTADSSAIAIICDLDRGGGCIGLYIVLVVGICTSRNRFCLRESRCIDSHIEGA